MPGSANSVGFAIGASGLRLTDEYEEGAKVAPRLANSSRHRQARQRVRTVVFILANTILGAGMLGVPQTFASCGYFAGTAMMVFFAGFSTFGMHLLSAAADISGRPGTLHSVAEAALPGFGVVFDLAIASACFGGATSYLIVVGDNMPRAMSAFGVLPGSVMHERRLWIVSSAALATPLAFLRQISKLRFTAALPHILAHVCGKRRMRLWLSYLRGGPGGWREVGGHDRGARNKGERRVSCGGPARRAPVERAPGGRERAPEPSRLHFGVAEVHRAEPRADERIPERILPRRVLVEGPARRLATELAHVRHGARAPRRADTKC